MMVRRQLSLTILLACTAAAQPIKVRPAPGAATVELPLEKYVAAVLAAEAGTLRSPEALKAMAVAVRTYAVYFRGRHSADSYDLCGTTHCQRFDLSAIAPRFEAAAAATAGELLWHQGKPVFACYSRDCGGMTEDARAIWSSQGTPYLRSHPDPYCVRAGASPWRWSGDPAGIVAALQRARLQVPRILESISIVQRTASGRARMLVLAGDGESVRISAGVFRFAVGRQLGASTVRSERFEVEGFQFHGAGFGHGVGLCQRGADQMGAENHACREILEFYYPGAELGVTAAASAAN
jgi:stage II sporulation protein D